ncbi:unnamed protein product [Pleuronectes platessa]|uniref:Uncharacterized protein n=1 Tax=Pleuronectes platessa TaxID=8262 RepID=A0A9N7Z7Z1_PLEPL|nr:unnamed protein product [Pleuronectes platessa]
MPLYVQKRMHCMSVCAEVMGAELQNHLWLLLCVLVLSAHSKRKAAALLGVWGRWCLSVRVRLLPLGALPFRRARPQEPPACQADLCSQMQPRRREWGVGGWRGEREEESRKERMRGQKRIWGGGSPWREEEEEEEKRGELGEVGCWSHCSSRPDTPCM